MGESSCCLVRSFSQPSPTSSEEKKGNPLQRALTTSISFGRFMSESLDWEKWSAFTHNRYLEEVERYSKPGSVAEKKAYFEAHFKRRRAAALLEQQNATANDFSGRNTENNIEADSMKEGEVQSDQNFPVDQNDSCDASVVRTLEDGQPGGIEKASEPTIVIENPVELQSNLEKDECVTDIVSKNEEKACNKDDSPTRNLASSSQKQLEVSSSKVSTNGSASKCAPSVEPIVPVQLKNSDNTPDSNNTRRDSGNKRRSYTTSLHMSINFASCSVETQKVSSPGLPKISNSRINRAPAKKYKTSMVPQTSTRASVSCMFKNLSATPPAENKRTITPNGNSISGSRTVDGKVQSPFTNYSKSSYTLGSKARLPTVTSSFTFRSEQRAEKRKEFFQKLEQKLKSKEMEKQKPRAKSQVKPRNSFADIHNSIALKATKNVEVPPTTELPNNVTKKIPTVKTFPKVEERAVLKVQNNNDSRPPWRLSTKTEWSKDASAMNNRPPISSTKGFSRRSMFENTSPNIQL